ncbi:MAG: hypothetical protein AAGG75_05200 [Bacteroidota bacterium]
MSKSAPLLSLLALLMIVQSACINVRFHSNSTPLSAKNKLGKTLLIGETTVFNQTLIEGLCQQLSDHFRVEGIDNQYHVFPPSELETTDLDRRKKLEELINELRPTKIIRLKKANGMVERTTSSLFSKKYPDYVFNTTLELNIYDDYPNSIQHKSLIRVDSWGSVRVELAKKSKKIAKRIYNYLEQDAW